MVRDPSLVSFTIVIPSLNMDRLLGFLGSHSVGKIQSNNLVISMGTSRDWNPLTLVLFTWTRPEFLHKNQLDPLIFPPSTFNTMVPLALLAGVIM